MLPSSILKGAVESTRRATRSAAPASKRSVKGKPVADDAQE
jgi:hypothetical protein